MQTPIRYTVVKQDGQPVIRAVPVPRRAVRPARRSEQQQERQADQDRRPLMQRIRRFGFR